MTTLSHLRALEERPELAAACASVAGEELTKSALDLKRAISSKRSAIKIVHGELPPFRQLASGKRKDLDYKTLPPLPDVHDPELARRAFRHKSTLSDAEIHSGNVSLDYERLEFIGDSYLHIICTRFLSERYPKYSEGQLSRLRELLTCNETLAEFSLRYGFDERLQINRKIAKYDNKSTERQGQWTKILGDLFEAFVCAVIQSRPKDGFLVVEDWLHVLWNHRIPGEEPLEVRKGAKTDLSRKVVSKGIKLTYEQTKPPSRVEAGRELFTMGVFLTGWGLDKVLLGEGTANSKIDAGQQAADKALLSPVTTQASFIKRKFDTLWKAEQEREGGPRQEVLDMLEADWK
jgi:ribonuclease III